MDGCQSATVQESIITDACHTAGDGNGCQAAAATESPNADARHAVGYVDGCQAAATCVFLSRYYTIF